MKWIVLEENPKPDNYIAILAAEEDRRLQIEKSHAPFLIHVKRLWIVPESLGKSIRFRVYACFNKTVFQQRYKIGLVHFLG